MNNVFFTSDEHYGHDNILWLGHGRPFKTTQEMNETIIDRHNQLVKPGDRVYHLGDMFWGTVSNDEAVGIMKRLNGNHFIILGNHRNRDEFLPPFGPIQTKLVWKKEIFNLKLNDQHIVLFHFPIAEWQNKEKGWWHLYGHVHGNFKNVGKSLDVGVDNWNFAPVPFETVQQFMNSRSIEGAWHDVRKDI